MAATVAGNVLDGWSDGPVGAVLNGWPGAAFVAAVEIAMWLVRAARAVAAGEAADGGAEPPPGSAVTAAQAAYRASVAGGNPLTPNQLQTRFGLTRAQAARVAPRTPGPAGAGPPKLPPPGGPAPPSLPPRGGQPPGPVTIASNGGRHV